MPTNQPPSSIVVGPGRAPAGSLTTSAVSSDLAHVAAEGSLAVLGLNEAYHRIPSQGATSPMGLGGQGITVDKGAITLTSTSVLPTANPDRWNSCLATNESLDATTSWPTVVGGNVASWSALGGSIGLFREIPTRIADSSAQYTLTTRRGPSILEASLLQFSDEILPDRATTNALTVIRDDHTGLLNPGGASPAVIGCHANDKFGHSGPIVKTAIRIGLDLCQVKLADGSVSTYIITGIVDETHITVVDLNYNTPSFTANTPVTLRIYQPSVMIGGSDITRRSDFMGLPGEWARPFVFGWAPYVTDKPGDDFDNKPGLFLSRGVTVSGSSVFRPTPAYEVGECLNIFTSDLNTATNIQVNFTQYGDGSSHATGGKHIVNQLGRNSHRVDLGNGVVFNDFLDMHLGGQWIISWSGAGNSGVTITINGVTPILFGDLYASNPGDEVTLILERAQAGTTGNFTINWPGNFKFSGTDGTIPQNANFKILYRFVFDGTDWLATRTSY